MMFPGKIAWWRALRLAAPLLLAVALPPLLAGGSANAREPKLQQTACWFAVPPDRDMTCGMLSVPENRRKPGSPHIRIAVAIFEPDKARHQPVVFLTGGPGQSAGITTAEEVVDWWATIDDEAWLRGRRLIVLDQRGVGKSEPALDCAPYFKPDVWNRVTDRPGDRSDFGTLQKQEVIACRNALRGKGVDLTAYNTRENAADIDDLRRALGIDRWVLYGVSYGTELALEVMNQHPEGILASVLDSVLPPDVDYLSHDAENLGLSLKTLDADCHSDPDCAEGGPTLSQQVKTIVGQLNATPVPLRRDGDKHTTARYKRVSGDDFLDVLFNAFYDRDAIETLPAMIRRTYGQDYGPLAQMVFDMEDADAGYFDGMDFSITCMEISREAPPSQPASFMARWAAGSDYSWICPLWTKERPQRSRPRKSGIPTLLLSGDYDPVTPAAWARHAAGRLSAGQPILFHGVGHDVIDTDQCGADVVADFLSNPTHPVRSACVARMDPPKFHAGNE